jgi:hypothetical protein
MVSQTSYRLISSRLTRDTVVPPPTYIRDPEIDSLPLVSDHRGHWFPLDAVILDDPHVHERFGNMVRDLKRRGATLLSLRLTDGLIYKDFPIEHGLIYVLRRSSSRVPFPFYCL